MQVSGSFKSTLHWGIIGLASLLVAAGPLPAVPDYSVKIADVSGSGQTNRPFTISRVFAQGEIPHFARARVAGSPILTQCDVKTRWPDGSVQHAVISFRATVPAGGVLNLDFVDQPGGNNASSLTQEQMLSSDFTFGAQIEVTNGTTLAANARSMLAAGRFHYWLQGPICTQVIIEDRTPELAFDLGWDAYKSLHPIFVATFYPGWSGVKVEMILENMWMTKLQDLNYSLSLRVGNPLEAPAVYTKPTFTHYHRTRWRKVFWSGPEPQRVNLDHNFPYLIHTKLLPNFDLTKSVSTTAVAAEISKFNATDRGDINGTAQVNPLFPTTGGRADIGLLPAWYVRYLYTFAPGLWDVLMGNAATSGHVPIHYRESSTGRYFDDRRTTDAFGRVVSVDARPGFVSRDLTNGYTSDKVTLVGPGSTNHLAGPWNPDLAHQPDLVYVPYLLTGDWYFLEELYFWASYNVSVCDAYETCSWCRHQDWGFINESWAQTRGLAWALRNLAHAALLAPDGAPEKAYFLQKLENNIAIREGVIGITNGSYFDDSAGSRWSWGRNVVGQKIGNPLKLFRKELGGPSTSSYVDTSKACSMESPWMLNLNLVVLGHLQELGFSTVSGIQKTTADILLTQISDPSYPRELIAGAYIGARNNPGSCATATGFDTWGAAVSTILPSELSAAVNRWAAGTADAEFGYPTIALAAASYLPSISGASGQAAWNWMAANVRNQTALNENPKWALLPRPGGPATEPSNPCDLNGDRVVDDLDFKAVSAQATGSQQCSNGDLNKDGRCNVLDVQLMASAIRTGTCMATR